MKKFMSFSAVVFAVAISASAAFAGDDFAVTANKRVTCQHLSMMDPYIAVRGSLQVNESTGEVHGQLRISFSTTQTVNVPVMGSYFKRGTTELADLRATSINYGIDSVYIDFKDSPIAGNSEVVTVNGIYRMTCNGSG